MGHEREKLLLGAPKAAAHAEELELLERAVLARRIGKQTLVGDDDVEEGGAPARAVVGDPGRALAVRGMTDVIAALEGLPGRRGLVDAALAAVSRSARGGGQTTRARAPDPAGDALLRVAERRGATLYRHAVDEGQVAADDPAVAEALARAGAGAGLPEQVRAEMERGLGVSLARVRIHIDDVAARATRAVCARAFTVGEDIFFARGAYAPGTAAGDKLLAHELAHVVQGYEGRTRSGAGIDVSRPGDALEREADAVADRVTARPVRARGTLRSYAPIRGGAVMRQAAGDGVAVLDELLDHLVAYWEREKQAKPEQTAEFDANIQRLRDRTRPTPRQSEAEMQEIHRLVGGDGERSYKHGRAAPRGGPGAKGATKPDVNLSTVMIEIKNYDIHSKKQVTEMVSELKRQIGERREHGAYDVKHQSVIVDVRGQKPTPGQLAALRKRIAARTGLAEEHIQFAQWSADTPSPTVPTPAAMAPSNGTPNKPAPSSTSAGSTSAGSTSAGSTSAGSTNAGSKSPGSTAAGSGTSGSNASGSSSTSSTSSGAPSPGQGSASSTKPGGGAGADSAAPTAKSSAAGPTSAAKEALREGAEGASAVVPPSKGRVGKLLGAFGELLTTVFSAKVQVPLALATEILGVFDAMTMALGGLSGEGFVMRDEIAHAAELEASAKQLLAWYTGRHDELVAAVTEANVKILGEGSREERAAMRDHAGGLSQAIRGRRGDVSQLASFAGRARDEAAAKIKLADQLLASREVDVVSAAAGMGDTLKTKIMLAREDLYRIRARLAGACELLPQLTKLLDDDAEMLGFYR